MLTQRDKKFLLKLREKIVSDCPRCRGMDFRCACIDLFRLEFKKVKANIAPKYRAITLEDITHPQTADVRAKIKEYIDAMDSHLEKGTGVFLYGSTGLAKTGIASIILIEALKRRRTGYFTTLDQCVNLYAGGWKDEKIKEQYQDLILDSDVLVLDEVGNETRTNVNLVGSCFNDVVRRRANNLQTTVLTSNLFFKKLKDVYGEEVYSILHECTIPFEFNGIDFRQGMQSI